MSSMNPSHSSPAAARAGSPSAMESEEWDLVSTPVKLDATGAAAESPVAPGAPERPPSAMSESKRRKTGKESPALDLSDQMEEAAPAAPTLSVRLQYDCTMPVRQKINMKALLTATPPPICDPSLNTKFSDIVLVIDASDSARHNGCMEASKRFLTKFLSDSVGLKRRVRMLLFGTHIQDLKIGGVELCAVTEETLPMLLAKVDAMKAWHPGTDIGTPVLEAISIIKRSRVADAARGVESPAVAHVITLSDGACHSCDYADPNVLTRAVRETGAPDQGIQTHYIGFSNEVEGDYMKKVSDSGKLGVFHAAPKTSDVPTAFEAVLNFLGCAHTFTFEATTYVAGMEEKTVHRLGALHNERTHLLDIDVLSGACGEYPVVAIQMLQGGQPIGQRVVASLVFEDGDPPQHENAEVLAAMKALEINEKVQAIFATTPNMQAASQQISALAEEIDDEEDEDGSLTRGLSHMAACAYRSMSAPSNFGAQVASQQAHGLSLLPEEDEEDDDEHPVPLTPFHTSLIGPPSPGAVEAAPPTGGSTSYRSLHALAPHGDEEEEEEEEMPMHRSLSAVPPVQVA